MKKKLTATENAVKNNNSPRFTAFTAKRCTKYAVKIIFFHHISPHFLRKFTVSSMNSPCSLFLPESALQLIFCQTRHHQTAHCRQSPSATIFYCSATFTHFFKIIQEFQTKPLVLINFPFEPLRNNASAVFFFSKTERINQSINYQFEQNSKSAI